MHLSNICRSPLGLPSREKHQSSFRVMIQLERESHTPRQASQKSGLKTKQNKQKKKNCKLLLQVCINWQKVPITGTPEPLAHFNLAMWVRASHNLLWCPPEQLLRRKESYSTAERLGRLRISYIHSVGLQQKCIQLTRLWGLKGMKENRNPFVWLMESWSHLSWMRPLKVI